MQDVLKFSFTLTYILLLTTGTITFIEALRTNNAKVRHVMNLETCISIIAGYFYGKFLSLFHSSQKWDWKDIIQTRYTDWCITTPLMLLTLCVVLGMHTNVPVHLPSFVLIVCLNYLMLYVGFLGETQVLSKSLSILIGFLPFLIMFGYIFYTYVGPKYVRANYILFFVYFIVWSFYGIVSFFNDFYKNIALNILDFVAKCFIGLGLWAYYTKIII